MRFAAVLLVAFACSGLFASDPGQPLDCSDWVFLEPGLSCSTILPVGAVLPEMAFRDKGVQREADNTGALFVLRETSNSRSVPGQLQLVRFDGVTETVVAYVADRNWSAWNTDGIRPTGSSCYGAGDSCPYGITLNDLLTFDRANGRFIISLFSYCFSVDGNHPCTVDYSGWSVIAITGFATMFEVLQTFTPQPPSLGFRVPYMPEGMAGADHFDTYWGNLGHPIDFTQAHPLECDYPSAPPQVGDYLTVSDTLADPAPGTGRYYVTAATYQGATRFGRKRSNGQTSGRDPAVLPACGQ